MSKVTARANGWKSKIRAKVEHVFTDQKDRLSPFIPSIGIDSAKIMIGLANLPYNMRRLVWLDSPGAPAKHTHEEIGRPSRVGLPLKAT